MQENGLKEKRVSMKFFHSNFCSRACMILFFIYGTAAARLLEKAGEYDTNNGGYARAGWKLERNMSIEERKQMYPTCSSLCKSPFKGTLMKSRRKLNYSWTSFGSGLGTARLHRSSSSILWK
ncbi:hypothetical protein SAY87_019424 [Trapa incisa]|uniref:Uncharacterized protein n=1 Tax=Trapa incisa TaxID=236973 RepID=A0AAN7K5R0_9MYRT|nr:hypothetical protein SAY87_019424 [Trapa incisa]